MWPDPTSENGIAVEQQVVRRDSCGSKAVCIANVMRGLTRRDVFEHNFQLGEVAPQRYQLGVNKHRFTVEQINLGRGHFTVHQQQQALSLHGFQRFVGFAQVRHTRIAVGGGARGVELGRHHTGVLRAFDFVWRQVVSQVERHERLKSHTGGHSGLNTPFIGQRLLSCGDRRTQVRHDDGATKLGSRMRHHRAQRIAVTHMQMPVVRTSDGQAGLGYRDVQGRVE